MIINFRNDDVSYDTPIRCFSSFCEIFTKYGFKQTHGITVIGPLVTGVPDLTTLDNQTIKNLSAGKEFGKNLAVVKYLTGSNDGVALHGLYHTDYSRMAFSDQLDDISLGLEMLNKLFPKKPVTFFIPPFNRFNKDTKTACTQLGLKILSLEGLHLEEELNKPFQRPPENTWYRFHHHRFYPESKFTYYNLTMTALDIFLKTLSQC